MTGDSDHQGREQQRGDDGANETQEYLAEDSEPGGGVREEVADGDTGHDGHRDPERQAASTQEHAPYGAISAPPSRSPVLGKSESSLLHAVNGDDHGCINAMSPKSLV